MGLFDIVKGGVEGFVMSGGNPLGGFLGAVKGKEEAEAEKFREQFRAVEQQQRGNKMSEIYGTGNVSSIQRPIQATTTMNAGFGSGFGQFLTDVGQNIVSPFANLFGSIQPFFGNQPSQPAVTTTGNMGGQETPTSGTSDAFIGGFGAPALITGAKNLLKSPLGNLILGTGAGTAVGMITDSTGKQRRITRKMKSQAKSLLNMTGGNLQLTADFLGIDTNTLVFILLKRFRNDGPVVTKAALRKTKQTVRRMKNMCDMYDDLRPKAATRRRTPMRRASTTLISNK
jgi:hypothetical protein